MHNAQDSLAVCACDIYIPKELNILVTTYPQVKILANLSQIFSGKNKNTTTELQLSTELIHRLIHRSYIARGTLVSTIR